MLNLQHNVVNILYAIKGMIEAHMSRFEEGRFSGRDEALSRSREVMKRVYAQAELALLITKKISLAMSASNNRNEPAHPISIRKAWDAVRKMLGETYPGNRFEIINHIPHEFPRIFCHRNDLVEILYCLADNAIQALEGKGKLIIRASLGFRSEGEAIANIVLADTGPGIPEETLTRLFEPFMTTKSLDKGNGLGLCLVKGLVRKNGGSISVSSFRGSGTTFTLAFPVAGGRSPKEMKDYAMTG